MMGLLDRRSAMVGAVLVAAAAGTGRLVHGANLRETFVSDPIATGAATVTAGQPDRFSYSEADHTLTAFYDTARQTAKLVWPFGDTVTADTSFVFDVSLSISNVVADPSAFAQIAFGLVNTATTGNDRVGGAAADAFDMVAVDYFPNVSDVFGGPTLGPTVIETDDGVSGYFPDFQDPAGKPGSIIFPFGEETDLTDEGPLPVDTVIQVAVSYDAASREIQLQAAGLDINSSGSADGGGAARGGRDGDPSTIQSILAPEAEFSVDAFAITLWQDTFGGGQSTVRADVTFYGFEVRTSIPEPSSLALVLATATVVIGPWRWRRGR